MSTPQYPKTWAVTSRSAGGVAARIVIPASPGVCHVITDVYGSIFGSGSGTGVLDVVAQIEGYLDLAHGTPIFELAGNAPGAGYVQQSDSWQGEIVGGLGASMTVSINAGIAGWIQTLTVKGYPI